MAKRFNRFCVLSTLLCCLYSTSLGQPEVQDGAECGQLRAEAQEFPTRPAMDAGTRQALAALQQRTDWDTAGWTLAELARQLQERLGCPVTLDQIALREYGLTKDRIIASLQLKGATGRSLLRHSLRELDLTWQIAHGRIEITSYEDAESHSTAFVLPVADLIALPGKGPNRYDYDSLMSLIPLVIEPDSWSAMTGPGPIDGFGGALVFSETFEIGSQAHELVETLRRVMGNETEQDSVKQAWYGLFASDAHYPNLDQPVTKPAEQLALDAAVRKLGRLAQLNTHIDYRALEDEEIAASQLVELAADHEPLSSIVSRITDAVGLDWTYQDDVLLVTGRAETDSMPVVRIYPVHDLVDSRSFDVRWSPFPWQFTRLDRDIETLLDLVGRVASQSGDDTKGPYAIEAYPTPCVIVVLQRVQVHHRIEALLARLRAAEGFRSAQRKSDKEPDSAVRTERLALAPGVSATETVKLVQELFPDCPMIRPFGDSLIIRAEVEKLRDIYDLLVRFEIVQPAGQTKWGFRLEGGIF